MYYGLKDWVNEWLYTYKRIMVKPSTFDSYVQYSTHITCDKDLRELELIDIQRMVNEMVLEGLKLSTVRHMVVVVRQSLKKARALGMIDNLACLDGLELPRASASRVDGLEDEYVDRLLARAPGSHYGDFFKALLYSGMRVGELIALRWCDVDWFAGCIYVINTDYHGQLQPVKTKSGMRSIPLFGNLLEIFEQMHAERRPRRSERCFLNTLGEPILYRSLLDRWHDFCARTLGMREKCGLHVLRHTFAHRALRAGVPVKVVSAWLGHANIQITLEIYDHVDRHDFKRAAQTLEGAFGCSDQTYTNKKTVR